jgi:hypothetical protein
LDLSVIGGAVAASWPGGSAAFAGLALAASGESSPPSVRHFAATGAVSSGLPPVHLSFDGTTAQLGVRTDAGRHTISEATAPDGFVNLTIDGQNHSSNPRSAAFDAALAGATAATVSGIHFQGDGEDTLILASQQHAGGFTVQAAGATVLTQDVVTGGPLAIQAPNITVSGAVRGSSVSLVASGWVNVNGAGRIEAFSGRVGVPTP